MPEDVRPRVRLFGELLAHWARERPGDTALIFGDRQWTWAEFDERVRRLSGALAAAGVGKGDRVAFVDKNHPACLETTFAAAGVGAANAVVNWRLSGDELAYVLNDSGAKIVFVGTELLSVLDAIRDRLPALERVVVVDEYESFVADAEPYIASNLDEDDGVLIMYTSGTTGFPKGAVLTHRSVIAHGLAAGTAFPIGPGDVNLVAMPLFHVGGSCYAVSGFLYGEPSYLTREPDAASLFAALQAGITHAFLVPAVVAGIAQAGEAALKAFSRLKYLCYGASPMPLPLLRTVLAAWPDVRFAQVYGMTELSGAVTALDPEAHRDATRPERLASAGTALSGVDICIVDPVTREDAQVGEVWVRTEQRMAGYLGKPEATAETIVDGWVRTGDVGRLDDGGFLFLEDRVKDMIITGGENVYSPEVERVVAEFPGVTEVAVIGVPDDRWGEQVKAVVAGEGLDADKLMEFCRERLAHYKCPRSVDVVEALPRNATGKILKRSLREPYWRDRDRNV
ncbi:Acyl-CoA synthetase (AMP-forming)/AMP-acid ligase II [Amycolatopsis pretoriensis]|uniref:Acyl-CoA synthetase (AMP-forming)/AMP-acid ligase II n=1 Tax=Amycolatopsis pretoriensis TaxID=218821 RepID=A0A1H5RD40_9PSEU|nr:long-chain fatty acid--CoA ligase [Amycolatopsis pretoriensis]SEF36276.1 Acyl-CoA synthetase (AMP-forming)/AMP-acid ligase II [Amycolatopsis pretoriensis]